MVLEVVMGQYLGHVSVRDGEVAENNVIHVSIALCYFAVVIEPQVS